MENEKITKEQAVNLIMEQLKPTTNAEFKSATREMGATLENTDKQLGKPVIKKTNNTEPDQKFDAKTFANRLKILIKAKNIKTEKLAKHLGVSQQQVSNYKNGVNLPSLELLCKIAQFFNVSADYLLGIETDSAKARKNYL